MYRSKFFKASKTPKHSLSTVEKCVSRGNFFLQNMPLGSLDPINILELVRRHIRTENSPPSKTTEHSILVAATMVNLSKPFEGHLLEQAQQHSSQICLVCSF